MWATNQGDDNLQTGNTCQNRERKAMHLFFMNVENASKVKRAFFYHNDRFKF